MGARGQEIAVRAGRVRGNTRSSTERGRLRPAAAAGHSAPPRGSTPHLPCPARRRHHGASADRPHPVPTTPRRAVDDIDAHLAESIGWTQTAAVARMSPRPAGGGWARSPAGSPEPVLAHSAAPPREVSPSSSYLATGPRHCVRTLTERATTLWYLQSSSTKVGEMPALPAAASAATLLVDRIGHAEGARAGADRPGDDAHPASSGPDRSRGRSHPPAPGTPRGPGRTRDRCDNRGGTRPENESRRRSRITTPGRWDCTQPCPEAESQRMTPRAAASLALMRSGVAQGLSLLPAARRRTAT